MTVTTEKPLSFAESILAEFDEVRAQLSEAYGVDEAYALEEVLGERVDEEALAEDGADEAWSDRGARELNMAMGPRRYGGRRPEFAISKDDKPGEGGNELAFAHGLSDPDADFKSPTPAEVKAARDRAAQGKNPQPLDPDRENEQGRRYNNLAAAIGYKGVGSATIERQRQADKKEQDAKKDKRRRDRNDNPFK